MKLSRALRYPLAEEDWPRTMGIGTVLEALTVLIVPQLILQGYYIQVMRRTVAGDDEPPSFEEWKPLVVDGAKATLLLGIYKLIPVTAVFVYFLPEFIAALSSGALTEILWTLVIAAVTYSVLFAAFGYLAAAGLVAFAESGQMRAAFSPRLARVLVSPVYATAYVQVLAIAAAAVGLKFVIALIPGVNLLLVVLVPFLVKYVWVVWARLWAAAYADVLVPDTRQSNRQVGTATSITADGHDSIE